MPTSRHRYSRTPTELSVWQREQLLSGHDFILGHGYGDPWADQPILEPGGSVWSDGFPGAPWLEDEAKVDWQANKQELMAYWAQDPIEWAKTNVSQFGYPRPGGPGTRPWAWWWFDSPAPRPIIAVDGPALSFMSLPGVLVRQCGAVFEPEAEYLARHGLLLEAERDLIDSSRTLSPRGGCFHEED